MQSQGHQRIASHGEIVITICAHLARAEPQTQCKMRCDRHRNLGAHCNRQSQNNRCIADCGETVIATYAHFASAEVPTHCKLRCDRQRILRVHCNRRISDASQAAGRQSSQLARTLQAQGHQRIASCGAAASQLACTLQSFSNRRIASCGATAIATFKHLTSTGPPTHCKLRWDRHRIMRTLCKRRVADASQVAVRPSS